MGFAQMPHIIEWLINMMTDAQKQYFFIYYYFWDVGIAGTTKTFCPSLIVLE